MWLSKFLNVFNYLFLGFSIYIAYSYSELELNSKEVDLDNIVLKMGGKYTAFVLGGSGGVGKGIVKALATTPAFEKVTLIGRRPIDLPQSDSDSDYDKFDHKTMDFDKIPEYADIFKGYDVGFYAIGVSSAKVSEAEFKKVELDNALALAKLIREGDCKDVHWVTGQGTSKSSWMLFGKVKAQVEEEISNMGFRRVSFYRPAMVLTSDKPSTSISVVRALDFCKLMSVETELLGKVMVSNALRDTQEKVEILENSHINKMGAKLQK